MKNENITYSFLQISMILMLTIGLTSHVIVNPMILDSSGRDAWISVLATGLLFCPWCGVLLMIMRKSGQQKLHTWLVQKTNRVIACIVLLPVLGQLYMMGGMTVLHTSDWTVINYLPATPKVILSIAIAFICQYAAKVGIQAITICSGVLLPAVCILGIFVATSNAPVKDYQILKPILEHGWQPVVNGMVYAGSGFSELILLLLLQHRLKSKLRFWKLAVLAIVLVMITVGPVIGAITEFGPVEAAKQITSPYEQWRLVKLGDYIEHVDFLSVFQWLSGSCIRISLSLFLLGDLLPIAQSKHRNWLISAVAISYVLISLLPVNENEYYLWTYHVYYPLSLMVTLFISAVMAVISLWPRSAKETST